MQSLRYALPSPRNGKVCPSLRSGAHREQEKYRQNIHNLELHVRPCCGRLDGVKGALTHPSSTRCRARESCRDEAISRTWVGTRSVWRRDDEPLLRAFCSSTVSWPGSRRNS